MDLSPGPVATRIARRARARPGICENAPLAVRESLNIARAAFDNEDATLMRMSLQAHEEGRPAFLERRKPRWSAC